MSENAPELRFPEFDREWDDKFLVDIATINPKSNNLPDNFVYINLESVESGVLKKENYITKNEAPSRAQRVLKGNDILYQTVRPYQKNNLFFEGNNSKDYVASTGYAQIRTLKNNPKFLYQSLHTERFVNRVLARCTGTSYPAINSKDLGKIHIKNPSIEEQNKIASFLSKVDEKIEKLEEKQQLWETYKKVIMPQIFNQKLRFKDENGEEYPDWKEKKLESVIIYSNGKTFENNVVENGKYFLITLNSLDIKGTLKKEHKTINVKDNCLKKDDLVMVLSDIAHGYFLGLTAVIPENDKYVLNQRMGALRPKIKINSQYLSEYINNNQRYFKLHGQGSSQQNLSKNDILNFKLLIPELNEQTKIANLLSTIDEKVDKVNKELELNRQFKKGLLQKMFC